jgi:hypothetical protein
LNCRTSSRNKPDNRAYVIAEPTWRTTVADKIIVYWRDIPAQVIIRKRRDSAKRELPLRFTEAIDMCAMRVGARDSDAYMAEWRKGDPIAVSDDLEAEADRALNEILDKYDDGALKALVKSEGRADG